MFSGPIPEDREERWCLLDEVIARWFPRSQDPGVDPAELDRTEDRLAIRLPRALREWLERHGSRSRVWRVQDHLLGPHDLFVDGDALVICRENPWVVQWGIALAQLADEDPPIQLMDRTVQGGRWSLESDRTSTFALQLAALNAKFGSTAVHCVNGDATAEACRAVERALPRLPLPDLRWPSAPTRFFGDRDLIVENDADTWLWVTARTRPALERVLEATAGTGMEWAPLER